MADPGPEIYSFDSYHLQSDALGQLVPSLGISSLNCKRDDFKYLCFECLTCAEPFHTFSHYHDNLQGKSSSYFMLKETEAQRVEPHFHIHTTIWQS